MWIKVVITTSLRAPRLCVNHSFFTVSQNTIKKGATMGALFGSVDRSRQKLASGNSAFLRLT
jgi:hypothetical protein